MKRKLKGVLGIGLTLVLLASLTIGLAVPAAADPGTLKWSKIALPKVGAAGDYQLIPGTDVGAIAVSPEGEALFAAATSGATPGADSGNAAAWSDEEFHSGSCSAFLTHATDAGKRAWVTFTPPGGITLASFVAAPTSYGFYYWRTL
ncbi:unnamed protein product, partial [marine sediment metagenome]